MGRPSRELFAGAGLVHARSGRPGLRQLCGRRVCLLGAARSLAPPGISPCRRCFLSCLLAALCRGAHSPDEQVLVPTVEPFWRATREIMHQLAQRRA